MNAKKLLVIMLIVCTFTPLWSATIAEKDVLTTLFAEGPENVGYTTQFKAAAPLATMEAIIDQVTGQLGTFVKVEGEKNPFDVVFSGGTATTYLVLDAKGNIAGLQFTEMIKSGLTLESAVAQIIDLDLDTSVLIRKNGSTLIAHAPDTPLAVGSSFKLAVLAAVMDAIDSGKLGWSDTVALENGWKSLPTGILQDWPEGTHLTIETLATLMISQSDNTATDVLIATVGRLNVEEYLTHGKPFLSTAEAFKLKNPVNKDLLERYRSATLVGKRMILKEIVSRPLPPASLFAEDPVSPDIEWYMSTRQLSDLIERLAFLDLMTVNAGLANSADWQRVAYKGGSEPGVLNLTTYLVDFKGNRYTVSVTVNDMEGPLDESSLFTSYQALLSTLTTH